MTDIKDLLGEQRVEPIDQRVLSTDASASNTCTHPIVNANGRVWCRNCDSPERRKHFQGLDDFFFSPTPRPWIPPVERKSEALTTQQKCDSIISEFDEWLAARVLRHGLKHDDLPQLNDAFRAYFAGTWTAQTSGDAP